MKLEILDDPDQSFIDFLNQKIAEFNWQHWEVSERLPVAIQIKDDHGNVVAGASGRSFGNWLQLSTLWVSEDLRHQQLGQQILQAFEKVGRERGCIKCFVDTLNFQAMPFYQKYGYKTQWIQEDYPKTGCRYFMVKEL